MTTLQPQPAPRPTPTPDALPDSLTCPCGGKLESRVEYVPGRGYLVVGRCVVPECGRERVLG